MTLRWMLIVLLVAVVASLVAAQDRPTPPPLTRPAPALPAAPARFITLSIRIDPRGQPLAAWQVEFIATGADVQLVGVESGSHPAYTTPPFYDPAALAHDRVILAALSTAQDLPSTQTRVATLHLRVQGEPRYTVKLIAAGNRQGQPIAADVTVSEGDSK